MFLVKAGTTLLIDAPFGKIGGPRTVNGKDASYTDTAPWKGYVTKEDKIYDKHEVIDMVAVANDRDDVKPWMRRNIEEHGYVILHRDGKYAMVKYTDIEFLD